MASLQCVFASDNPNLIFGKRKSHIFHRNTASLQCVFAYAYPNLIFGKSKCHIFHRNTASLQCVFAYAYPNVIFGKGRVTYVTWMWPLSRVYSPMINQMRFLGKGRVTYFTEIWLLSGVCSYMLSKSDCRAKEEEHITQICCFSLVCPSLSTWTLELVEKIETLTSQVYDFSPKCVSICTSYSTIFENDELHILHDNGFSLICVCIFRKNLSPG